MQVSAAVQQTSRVIFVDSRDRNPLSYKDTNSYVVKLPAVYRNVASARVLSAELPAGFHHFCPQLGNVSLQVKVQGAPATSVAISSGNYGTPAELAMELQVALRGVHADFSVTLDAHSGCVRIGNSQTRFELNSAGTVSDGETHYGLMYFLGFPKGVQASTPIGSTVHNLQGSRPVITTYDPYVLLEIEGLNTADECSPDDAQGYRVKAAFAKLQVRKDPSSPSHIFWESDMVRGATSLNASLLTPPIGKLDALHVRWRFHDGQLVPFQGLQHSFTLELVTIDSNFTQESSVQTFRNWG